MTFASALLSLFLVDNFSVLSRVDQFVQDWEIASVFAPHEAQDPDYCHGGRGRADPDALSIPFTGRQAISFDFDPAAGGTSACGHRARLSARPAHRTGQGYCAGQDPAQHQSAVGGQLCGIRRSCRQTRRRSRTRSCRRAFGPWRICPEISSIPRVMFSPVRRRAGNTFRVWRARLRPSWAPKPRRSKCRSSGMAALNRPTPISIPSLSSRFPPP